MVALLGAVDVARPTDHRWPGLKRSGDGMVHSQNPPDLSEYNKVLTAFVELRGRGITVSAQDLEILKTWATDRLPPDTIIDTLVLIAQNCEEKGLRFATTLKALDRQVRGAIREGQEY